MGNEIKTYFGIGMAKDRFDYCAICDPQYFMKGKK
jgi:hypothetical protein